MFATSPPIPTIIPPASRTPVDATCVQVAGALDALCLYEGPLGAHVEKGESGGSVSIHVWAPTAQVRWGAAVWTQPMNQAVQKFLPFSPSPAPLTCSPHLLSSSLPYPLSLQEVTLLVFDHPHAFPPLARKPMHASHPSCAPPHLLFSPDFLSCSPPLFSFSLLSLEEVTLLLFDQPHTWPPRDSQAHGEEQIFTPLPYTSSPALLTCSLLALLQPLSPQEVTLLLFDQPHASPPVSRQRMERGSEGQWSAQGPMAWQGMYYQYEIRVFHPATNRIETCVTTDPYSRGLSANGERSLVVDLSDAALAPPDWSTLHQQKPPLQSFSDVSIYELHIRDFRYDPVHWGVPDGSYATHADGAARTLEFRSMVQAVNGMGLRVVLDVVYNHLYASGPHSPFSVLDKVVPGYYVRRDMEGRVESSACCNNTASEHAMVERLIVDDVVMWATQYKVDGFRFDLMGHLMKHTMVMIYALLNQYLSLHTHYVLSSPYLVSLPRLPASSPCLPRLPAPSPCPVSLPRLPAPSPCPVSLPRLPAPSPCPVSLPRLPAPSPCPVSLPRLPAPSPCPVSLPRLPAPSPCPVSLPRLPAPSPCPVSLPRLPAPSPCPVSLPRLPAPSPCPVSLPRLPAPSPCPVSLPRLPAPSPCPVSLPRLPAPSPCPVSLPRLPAPSPCPVSLPRLPAPSPCPVSLPRLPAPSPCPVSLPRLPAPSPCPVSLPRLPAPSPCPVSLPRLPAPSPCPVSLPRLPAPSPCPVSLPRLPAPSPCPVSLPRLPAPSPCPVSLPRLPAPSPCPVSLPRLPAPSPCPVSLPRLPAPSPCPVSLPRLPAPSPCPVSLPRLPAPSPCPVSLPRLPASSPYLFLLPHPQMHIRSALDALTIKEHGVNGKAIYL
ncbi:unnamed protein product [Closterium sp. Yama58-4]|nr:unnamed protein product [Closterium sp. Yama58-4]